MGYYAEEQPMGGYGQPPEMVGLRRIRTPLANTPEAIGYYAEPEISVTSVKRPQPPFNPGCPMPTNVAGFGDRTFSEADRSPATNGPHGEPVVRTIYASTRRDRVVARNFQTALVSTNNHKHTNLTGELLWQPSKALEKKSNCPSTTVSLVEPEKQLREVEPGSTLKFFVNVQGKTKLETNLQSASLLPHYNTFEARAMRVVISDLPPEFPDGRTEA